MNSLPVIGAILAIIGAFLQLKMIFDRLQKENQAKKEAEERRWQKHRRRNFYGNIWDL